MEKNSFCQSCTMPLNDQAFRGTEKDGSLSDQYCTYCYQHGAFTSPALTMEQMQEIVTQQMKRQHLDPQLIARAVAMVPELKRWKKPSLIIS